MKRQEQKRGLCLPGHTGQGSSGYSIAHAKLLCSSMCTCSSTRGWLLLEGSSYMCSATCGWLLHYSDCTNNVAHKVGHAVVVWLLHIRCSSCYDGSTTQIPRGQVQKTSRPLFAFQFPQGEPEEVFYSVWVVLDNPNKCCRWAFC